MTSMKPSSDEASLKDDHQYSIPTPLPDATSLAQDGGQLRDDSRFVATKPAQIVTITEKVKSIDLEKEQESESALKGSLGASYHYNACLQRCESCGLVLIDYVCPRGHIQHPPMKMSKRLLGNDSDAHLTPSKKPKYSAAANAEERELDNPNDQLLSVQPQKPLEDRTTVADASKPSLCSEAMKNTSQDVINESAAGGPSVINSHGGTDVPIADQAYHDTLDDIWRCKICHWEIVSKNANDKYGHCFQGHRIELFKIQNWKPADLCSEDEISADEDPDSDDEDAIDDSEVTAWIFNVPAEMDYETDIIEEEGTSDDNKEKSSEKSDEEDEFEERENESLYSSSVRDSKVYKILQFFHLV
ncbi:MAG: hypothetical protein Q9191_008450 [Dirinaria sp. TL-2023a]